MLASQIMLDAAAAQVRSGKRVGDRAIFRNHADVPGSIDKNTISRQQFVDLIKLGQKTIQKFLQLWDETLRQIARLSADACVGSGEARAGQELEKIVKSFRFVEGIDENRERAEMESQRAEPEQR